MRFVLDALGAVEITLSLQNTQVVSPKEFLDLYRRKH